MSDLNEPTAVSSYSSSRGRQRGSEMRRTVVALLALITVAGGGFGLGYFFGHEAAPSRPGAVRSPAPRTVIVPTVLHLSMPEAVQTVMSADLAVGRVGTRTGGEPGTIVAQFPPSGTSAPPASPVDLFVSTVCTRGGRSSGVPTCQGPVPWDQICARRLSKSPYGSAEPSFRTTGERFAFSLTPRPCHFENVSGPSRERRAASMSAPSECTGAWWHSDAARTWPPGPLSSWLMTERTAPARTSICTWSAGPTA
jgi:hypothetical protein